MAGGGGADTIAARRTRTRHCFCLEVVNGAVLLDCMIAEIAGKEKHCKAI